MSFTSKLHTIARRLQRKLRGESIVFARGDISIEISKAVRGSTNWSTDAPFPGSRIGERSSDWLIAVGDLAYVNDDDATIVLEPERGDTFTTDSGEVFRVMPFVDDGPLWQWNDRSGQTVRRIFTKERN